MKTVTSLDLADAQRAVTAITLELTRRGKSAAIAVADVHGDPVLFVRTDGARPTPGTIALNKAWTAARQCQPTRNLGDRVRASGKDAIDILYFGDPKYVGFAGGLPVLVGGVCVGAVGVSGLHEDEDEELAALGVAEIQNP